jgi:arylformamidase
MRFLAAVLSLATLSLATLSLATLPLAAQTSLPPSWGTSGSAAPTPSTGTSTSPQGRPAQQQQAPRKAAQKAPRNNGPVFSWLDCTAPLSPSITPVYEGNPPIQFSFTMDMNNGAPLDLSLYSFGSHTGTHVDAPLHFIRNGAPIDAVPLDILVGPALVINIDPQVIAITPAELDRYPWRGQKRILFRTRNSVNAWMIDPHFHRDFTFLTPEAAQLLVDNGIQLVGIDYLSIEQFGSTNFRTHITLLGHNVIVVEGLDLRAIAPGEYDFAVLPLKILGHEAAPARAMLRPR